MKLLSLFFVLLAFDALAQGKPTLIDHPLDVKSAVSETELTALQDTFRQLLARNSAILLTTRSNWKTAVAALKRQDCDVRNECLRQLATTAGTLYAIFASIERNVGATEVTAMGRVVNQDGVQVRAPVRVTVKKKGSFEDAARDALGQLIAKLELEKLSPVLTPPEGDKPVAVAPSKPPEPVILPGPPPTPPPSEQAIVAAPRSGMSSLRVVSLVVGGLALGTGAVSAGFGASAASLRGTLPTSGPLLSEDQVRAQGRVNQGATIALATGVAAGVLAVAAISLFAASSSSADASVALTPVPGGAAFVVGGAF